MSRRVNGETPAGGTYCTLTFVDAELRVVPEKDATHVVVSEFADDGEMLAETVGTKD
jgi:hypothetical protein